MKVSIDENACIGCGLCVGTAPDVFDLDGSVAKVIAQPTVANDAAAKEALENCPVDAIHED
ncbi:MAG: ferredoxin [Oscillospiraceae bacterium]